MKIIYGVPCWDISVSQVPSHSEARWHDFWCCHTSASFCRLFLVHIPCSWSTAKPNLFINLSLAFWQHIFFYQINMPHLSERFLFRPRTWNLLSPRLCSLASSHWPMFPFQCDALKPEHIPDNWTHISDNRTRHTLQIRSCQPWRQGEEALVYLDKCALQTVLYPEGIHNCSHRDPSPNPVLTQP